MGRVYEPGGSGTRGKGSTGLGTSGPGGGVVGCMGLRCPDRGVGVGKVYETGGVRGGGCRGRG